MTNKLWDFAVYMILAVLLINEFSDTNPAIFYLLWGGLILAYALKSWDELRKGE